MQKIIGLIPARYASTRFPGKPLALIGDKSMIQRVYEQCKKCGSLAGVAVATDDQRIFDHVTRFGGKVIMTSAAHQSGTDRCAEAAAAFPDADAVINIQGDEPFVDPDQISLVASIFDREDAQIGSLYRRISDTAEIANPNVVKVTMNLRGDALYFSRSAIPFQREPGSTPSYYRHIGIYGYRLPVLEAITRLPQSMLERAESLEQLRWLENGHRISLRETTHDSLAVDTPEDLRLVEKILTS
jgi:3-deoxy-manno-octulosonate cytidylyltransferase (CMP-KDO synthetase)